CQWVSWGFLAVQWVVVGVSAAVMDAVLVLSFLVTGQVSWLPVGTAGSVLPLVTAVRVLRGTPPVQVLAGAV
ncbi:hypothetical protein, partial [Streptomyces scopuliridis]|uniref:hypothetical protein n=1 Tax=Streptomyces scopuliridis TaxID=452529 RepID=UPI0036C2F8AF